MKCPLKHRVIEASKEHVTWRDDDCLKEDCACWDKAFECCDPTGLAHTLERLTDVLAELVRTMPKSTQFGK